MNWLSLESISQIDELIEKSYTKPILIFKHSTRCSISTTALDRIERKWRTDKMDHVEAYYLDLIRFRDVSNAIEKELNVFHQSPQAIVLVKGEVVYDDSHFSINYDDIRAITL
jgi:bacillithiol system protein YtxJ